MSVGIVAGSRERDTEAADSKQEGCLATDVSL